MHIMDILQNSIRAGATEISLEILEDTLQNIFRFNISDNGCGIPPDVVPQTIEARAVAAGGSVVVSGSRIEIRVPS